MKTLMDLGIESPALKQYWWALVGFTLIALIYLLFLPMHYISLVLLASLVLGVIIGFLVAAAAPIWARKGSAGGDATSGG